MTSYKFPIAPLTKAEAEARWSAIAERRRARASRWRVFVVLAMVVFLFAAGTTIAAVMKLLPFAPAAQEPPAPKPAKLERPPEPAPDLDAETVETPPPVVPPQASPRPLGHKESRTPAGEAPTPLPDSFERALLARGRGDFVEALELLQGFVVERPFDPRAGVAALEVARIIADTSQSPRRALDWAERAVTLARGATVREDARARVVELLGEVGEPGSCTRARESFMADYPHSMHAAEMRHACGE